MAALPTPDASPDARDARDARGEASGERYRLLRELGAHAVPAWAALESVAAERTRLVVVERAARSAYADGEIADWIRDARRLFVLDHPNVGRVRDIIVRSADILVVSEFLDGARWREFAPMAPLETAVRVFVDALTGLSALHNLRDASDPKKPLFKLAHRGLTPDCIVVGLDGAARIVGVSRPRSATARLAFTKSAYLAPEVLLEDDSADARADVYSVGVMLWEALCQRRFLPDLQPSAIVTQLLSGRVPAVTLPESTPWATPLADVVRRALSADPEKRFPSATAMAAELRRIAALKLPLAVRVAAGVRAAFGDAAKARREELERGEVRGSDAHRRSSRPPSEDLSVDVTDDLAEGFREPSQTASTVPPPMLPEPDRSPYDLRSVGVAARPLPAVVGAAPQRPPPATAPPRPPLFAAPPQPPLFAAPPQPPEVTAPPRPPVDTFARRSAPPPAPRSSVPSDILTAAPFALATSARPEPSEPRGTRPKGMLRIAVGAVIAIGGATWWIAARDTHPAAVHVGPAATAQSAVVTPRESATESLAPQATLAPAGEADLPPTPALEPANATTPALEPANATTPALEPANATTPANGPANALTRPPSPTPAGAPPLRPKRLPTRRGYDPQGI